MQGYSQIMRRLLPPVVIGFGKESAFHQVLGPNYAFMLTAQECLQTVHQYKFLLAIKGTQSKEGLRHVGPEDIERALERVQPK